MFVIILVSCFSIVCSLDNILEVNKVNGTSASIKLPNNTTKFVSEGGIVSTDSPLLSLLKDNNTALLSVINESGKIKKNPSKPRKGAFDEQNELQNSSNEHQQPNIAKAQQLNETANINITLSATNHTIKTDQNELPTIINKSTTLKPITKKPTTIKSNIKKPLVLSYSDFAQFDNHKNISTANTERNEQYNLTLKPSSKTLTQSQLPSPNKDSIIYNKAQNINNHPGMIMPLVISILVVPLFAVLGYMAFKRGQEAWRNRHYKRMDFLLDGMYND